MCVCALVSVYVLVFLWVCVCVCVCACVLERKKEGAVLPFLKTNNLHTPDTKKNLF